MRRFVYGLIVILAILHQDFWWWDDSDMLVMGFIPIGLAYHAAISVAATVLWAMAVVYCWPHDLDADQNRETPAGGRCPPYQGDSHGAGTAVVGETLAPAGDGVA